MEDYTKGGGIIAGVIESVTYFLLRNNLNRLETGLLCYLFGLISYFAYLGYKKNETNLSNWVGNETWIGSEIFTGFLGVTLPLFPIIMIGEIIRISQ